MTEVLDKQLIDYLESMTQISVSSIPEQIHHETQYLFPEQSHMILGHHGGSLLRFLATLVGEGHIIEIGTFTGFSACYLADGLGEKGKLYSVDKNEAYQDFAKRKLSSHPRSQQINFILADGIDFLKNWDKPIDLLFLDANKKAYLEQYQIARPKLSPKGFIVVDNTLFHREVFQKEKSPIAENIHHFNQEIHKDKSVNACLLPIRDGMWMISPKI